MERMGLVGANNPIFQASQQMAQQSGQQKDLAIQGIINQNIQNKTRQLAAEMESYNNLIQSKDPKLKMIGLKGLFERAGKSVPEDIQQRFDEVTAASSDLAKIMKSDSIPAVKKEAWDAFITNYGTDYVSPEQTKIYENKFSPMNQPVTLEIAKKYGLPEGTTIEQAKALGVNLEDKKTPAYHVIKDKKSPTGYSYQDLNNTATVIPNAPAPASEHPRDAYKDNAVMTRIVDKFNADPNVRKIGQMEEFSNIITAAANSDNPIAQSSIPTLMARASGEVGNLSEADKRPFGGSKAILTRLQQSLSEMASGKTTPENLGYVKQLAETFVESGRKQKEKIARERAKQYASANKGMFTAEEVFNALSPTSGDFKSTEGVPTAKTIVRTGTQNGKKVVQYSDGTIEYVK